MEPYQTPPPLFQLNLDANNGYTLRSAASWAKVMAFIGIIMGVLFLVGAFRIQQAASRGGAFNEILGNRGIGQRQMQSVATFYMILLVVIALIFILSGIFSLNFGNKISSALRMNDQNSLRMGFSALRNLFAFRTIIMIIWLLILIFLVIAMLSQPSSTRFNNY